VIPILRCVTRSLLQTAATAVALFSGDDSRATRALHVLGCLERQGQPSCPAAQGSQPSVAPEEAPEPAEEKPVSPAKTREPKVREPRKEPNVIDITEAEIVAPMQGGEGRLKIPRVRPVIIPPPQVRSL